MVEGATFGIVGLGTMGRNLALNVESRGYRVAVWNREQDWTDAFALEHARQAFVPAASLEATDCAFTSRTGSTSSTSSSPACGWV